MIVVLVLRAQKVVQDVDDGGDVSLWLAVAILERWVQGSWKRKERKWGQVTG